MSEEQEVPVAKESLGSLFSDLAKQIAEHRANWDFLMTEGELDEEDKAKFPMTINKLTVIAARPVHNKGFGAEHIGSFVSVRPVKSEKTYLGLLIGMSPVNSFAELHKTTKELKVSTAGDNPVIFVFDLNRVVFGCECWWGVIKSEEDLRQITDADIQDIWYVKALKEMLSKKKEN